MPHGLSESDLQTLELQTLKTRRARQTEAAEEEFIFHTSDFGEPCRPLDFKKQFNLEDLMAG
jgi:hypothetical protein